MSFEIINAQSRFIMLDEDCKDNLSIYELSVFSTLLFESNYSQKSSEVRMTIEYLAKKSKMSERKVYECLNALEFTHYVIKRMNYKNMRYGQTNSFLIARDYLFFKPNDQINNTPAQNDIGVQFQSMTAPNNIGTGQSYTTPAPNAGMHAKRAGTHDPVDIPIDHNVFHNHSIKDTTTSKTPFFEEFKKMESEGLELVNEEFSKQQLMLNYEKEALSCEKCIEVFKRRFTGIPVTLKELYDDCADFWKQKGQMVYKSRFLSHLKKCPPSKFVETADETIKPTSITSDEKKLVSEYISFQRARQTTPVDLIAAVDAIKAKAKKIDSAIARELLASISNAEESFSGGGFNKIVAQAKNHMSEVAKRELAILRAMR